MRSSGPSSIGRMLALIDRATRPTLREPDLALNLQIADIINEKKGTAPREAATAIVKTINSPSSHRAILAMSVLDVCVKNCGFPFHLQISRKDFLNNLVRRFPERPPLHYSRVQMLILEAIEEWRETLCRTSKYRDDLGYIRDMHRLLSYKGYMFPEINRDDAAVLNMQETLKSAAELEEEDREVQSAKLQELLRSSNPEDLREANHLMSVMAGFKETKVDYHAKVAKELDKVRRKAEILEEMLNNLQPSEPIANDDVFSELVAALRNAKPKLQKIVEDESNDDEEARAKMIALYDYISQLVAKYELVSQGDYEGAKNVTVASLASGKKIDTSRQAVIDSLIDIDDVPDQKVGSDASAADLLGLNFGGLTLGGGQAAASSSSAPSSGNDLLDFGNDVSSTASPTPSASAAAVGTSASASPAPLSPPAQTSALDLLGEWKSSPAPNAPSSEVTTTICDDEVKIELTSVKENDNVSVTAFFTNLTDKKITNLKFEVAVPKTLQLSMQVQSGSVLEVRQVRGVSQKLTIAGSSSPKLRWRALYKVGISDSSKQGTCNL